MNLFHKKLINKEIIDAVAAGDASVMGRSCSPAADLMTRIMKKDE